jgi:voltage-gated potassium channel
MTHPRNGPIKFLIALILLIVSAPFIQDLPEGYVIEPILITLVMISAVLAVGDRRRVLVIALILLAPALAGKWINHLNPKLMHPAVYLGTSVVFFGFVVARLLAFIVRAKHVDANVLSAGVAGFLTIGAVWSAAYLTVARINPAAFTMPVIPGTPATMDASSAMYFSVVTLTTVGYGDIAPVSRVARMLAMVEAITGMFYMAMLIARLVSVYSSAPPPAGAPKDRSA